PEPRYPIPSRDGFRVNCQTVTNAKPMFDVTVFSGLGEIIIPGEQITARKTPQAFTHDWFPNSGVHQLYSSSGSAPSVIIRSNTYSSYDSARHHGSTTGVTSESGNSVLNLCPTHTDQPPDIQVQNSTYQAAGIQALEFYSSTASNAGTTLTLTPPIV
ncbi:hypothetical protein N9L68_02990, partial [bacterium]|nr:hypothetical protein [bacterium]